MANDHDKFTCGCDACEQKYRDYYRNQRQAVTMIPAAVIAQAEQLFSAGLLCKCKRFKYTEVDTAHGTLYKRELVHRKRCEGIKTMRDLLNV